LDAFNVLLPEVLGVALDKRQDENVRKLFDGFRKIVEDTYPNRPILLAYDHLDGMETTALMKTIAQFARWLREASRVHTLLIIGNQKDQELLDNHTPVGEPHFNVMTVQLFDPKQYKDLSSEFVRRLLIARHVRSDQPLDEQAYEAYKAQALPLVWNAPVQGHWPPTLLANFEHILSLLNLLPGG
jgi:hypothetical protein